MDDLINTIARELREAITAAIQDDSRIDVVLNRARTNGFELRLSLEAVIEFVPRRVKSDICALPVLYQFPVKNQVSERDKRFLQSLRVGWGDETT